MRPFFVNQQTVNIWYVPKKKDVLGKPDDILSAAEKYIAQNGTDEFKKIINKVSPPSLMFSENNSVHAFWEYIGK